MIERYTMTLNTPEIRDIGRFVRARRMAADAASMKDFRLRRRHVPYVTQSELAELIDVSPVVISQIEQGRYPNLNAAILKRISQVLSFTVQQEMYAIGLLSSGQVEQISEQPTPKWMVDSIADTQHPVFVLNPVYDMVAWNQKAEHMLGSHARAFFATGNAMLAIFSIPEMKQFFVDWQEYTRSTVSGLRMSYGVHPEYRAYVVSWAERMSAADEYFQTLWNKDDPLVIPTIEKEIDHPELGRMRMIQVNTVLVEAPHLTTAEFLPADDATRAIFTDYHKAR